MATVLKILSSHKNSDYVIIHKVAVVGGELFTGAKVRIPQGGAKPSFGVVTSIHPVGHNSLFGKAAITRTGENTIVGVVIKLGDKVWNPARKPDLEVVAAEPPVPVLAKDKKITYAVLKYTTPPDAPHNSQDDLYVALDGASGGYPYRTDFLRAHRWGSLEAAARYIGESDKGKYVPVEVELTINERLV